jgi:thiamine kinase-like enzyme
MDSDLRKKINIIMEKITELRQNKITDSFELEMYFIENMTDYYESYPHLIKRLCREEKQDNSFLYKMIDNLEQVNKGQKSMTSVELTLANELANKYLYPVLDKTK